jgi:AcrR family transcriptional regulator
MNASPAISGRPLRADAEQSMTRILEAAERVFARNPAASLEAVAQEAGVARTTVHRRFSSRDELRDALVDAVNDRLRRAMESANITTAPPLVALYQLTVATLEMKVDWRFSWELIGLGEHRGRGIDPSVTAGLEGLLLRARDGGLLRASTDIRWTSGVYRALIHEAAMAQTDDEPPAYWANVVMQSLLCGAGTPELDFDALLSGGRPGDS